MKVAIGGYLRALQLSKMPLKLTYWRLEGEKPPSEISIENKWTSTLQVTLELMTKLLVLILLNFWGNNSVWQYQQNLSR